MTIVAPHREQERRAAERDAWTAYRERLHDLSGRAYEDAESQGWDELQERLREIAQAYSPQG